MLNELHILSRSLHNCGLESIKRHPDVKQPGRKAGFVLGLDASGCIKTVEYRDKDAIAELWTTSQGNHNSFPVIKLQRPIWDIAKDHPVREQLKKIGKNDVLKRISLMAQASKEASLNCGKVENDWWNRLRERVSALLPCVKDKDLTFAALPTLMQRFVLPALNVEGFLKIFSSAAIDACLNGSIGEVEVIETALIGQWKSDKCRAEIPLVLDVADFERFDCRVASARMEQFVNKCLLAIDAKKESKIGICSLNGKSVPIESDKFPNPKLPIVGPCYLMSMNENVPCQTRYGRTSTAVFPVGRALARELQDAIRFVTDGQREGKTWARVPATKPKEQNLLVVYLEEMPHADIQKASLFGRTPNEEVKFRGIAKTVCNALKGIIANTKHSMLRLFVLHKVDKGRTQVILSETLFVDNILNAAEKWQEAANNAPEFSLPLPGKKGEKGIIGRPEMSVSCRSSIFASKTMDLWRYTVKRSNGMQTKGSI